MSDLETICPKLIVILNSEMEQETVTIPELTQFINDTNPKFVIGIDDHQVVDKYQLIPYLHKIVKQAHQENIDFKTVDELIEYIQPDQNFDITELTQKEYVEKVTGQMSDMAEPIDGLVEQFPNFLEKVKEIMNDDNPTLEDVQVFIIENEFYVQADNSDQSAKIEDIHLCVIIRMLAEHGKSQGYTIETVNQLIDYLLNHASEF